MRIHMEPEPDPRAKYASAKMERSMHLASILKSHARKKIVVAGPGTGKTFLFKEILRDKENCLTLTFVNALVEDLSLELNGLSEVRTLHSFARNLIKRLTKKEIAIFPKLAGVIGEDAMALLKEDIDFNRLFHERDDEDERIEFYRQRKDYYGDYYGYSDVIYAAVRYLEVHRDKIPGYNQVVVDEFQDSNRLEVSLIDLLSEKSPVLLAGDDDQALYDFKSASPDHIRSRYGDKAHGYEPFNLPFCSRCPRVVVEAANDIIERAIRNGSLQGRISKPYHYFEDEAKNAVSDENPTISYGQVFATQIPWAIERQIIKIAASLRAQFSVLIISPTKTQSHHLTFALKKKGFEKIEYADKRGVKDPTLLDGLKLLLTDYKNNLGWRIAAKCLLEGKFKRKVKDMLVVLKKIAKDKPIDEDGIRVLKTMDLDPFKAMRDILNEELDLESLGYGNPAVRKISIKTTTIESSKGLSSDYIFITHFDDQYFVRDKNKGLTDKDICNFLVALTRARKKVFLISSRKAEPTFLRWIKKERIEAIVR
jgi:superfamily I DNA/RNA helicase